MCQMTAIWESLQEDPTQVLLLCDLPDGGRALVSGTDPALLDAAQREEMGGAELRLDGGSASLA